MPSEPPSYASELRIVGPSFRTLAKVLDVGILFIDVHGRVEYASPSACDLLAVATEDDVQEVWARMREELLGPQHPPGAELPELSVVASLPLPGGTSRRLRVRVRKLAADECIGHLVTLRDLALIEGLERDVRLAGRYRNLTRIHAAAAHDLRGALNAISLTLQVQKRLLEKMVARDGDEARSCAQYTTTLIEETQRLTKLTDDLLVHSIEAPEPVAEFDLRTCVHEFTTVITPMCKERGIELKLERCPTPLVVSGRSERLKQALMNLAINSVDALEGRVGRIVVEPAADRDHAVLRMTDSGPGIPEPLLGRIWDLHFTTKRSGSGIGLHVVRMVVDDHHGAVRVWNRPEGGCTFEIRIPLARRHT
jgi:signal transduction histidine kinase